MLKKIYHYLRYDWPLHFILFCTNWLPDNVIFLYLRGVLIRPFFASSGKNLAVGRNVVFHNPSNIRLGQDIHISYGCIIMATEVICVGSEVMFGPYCVLVSGNHIRHNGSFRFGTNELLPITIEYGAWLGASVVVTAGVTIGNGALVAAGSVVTRDIPDNVMAGGVPAKILKKIEDGS